MQLWIRLKKVAFQCVAFAAIAGFLACNNSPVYNLKSENGYFQVKMTEPAGSDSWKTVKGELDTIDNYLSLPVPMGEFKVPPIDSLNSRKFVKAFVLGKSLKDGEVLEILPLAIYKIKDDKQIIPVILAVPKDKDRRLFDAESYFEMQRECYTCLKIMEEWIVNYPKFDSMIFFGWENEEKAERLLEEYATYN